MCKYTFENSDAVSFLKKQKPNSVDLILTDPPYQISRKTGFTSGEKKGDNTDRFRISMDFGEWDSLQPDEHTALINDVSKESYRVLRQGGVIIVFYDIWKIESLSTLLKNSGFKMLRFIEWIKTNPVPINSKNLYLTNAREIAIVAVKGSKPIFKTKYHNGIFSGPIHRDGGKRLHPTQKPLKLMKELIELHTDEGNVVMDPFSGSATTLVAALETKRKAKGCELNPKYFKVALNRLKESVK